MAAGKSSLSLSKLPVAVKAGGSIVFAVLVALLYVIAFYSDVSSSIRNAKSQETTLRGRLADARKIEFAYQQDLADLNERQQRQRELNKALPESTAYPAFLSSLQSVANVSGVSLLGWSPVGEIPEQFYSKVPMKIKLSGRFHQIAKFFYGVGQLDRIINIEDISLKQPKVEGSDVILTAECMATAFRGQTFNPAAPAAPDPKGKGKSKTPPKGKPAAGGH